MLKLTGDELTHVIYEVLRTHEHGTDLKVAALCAVAVMEADLKRVIAELEDDT